MMRRSLALVLVFAGLAAAAHPAAAQAPLAPLPSGVTLRINGPASHIAGVLDRQSVDSVWLRPRGENEMTRSVAVANITRVEMARPAYARSVLMGTVLGGLVGAALYPIVSHNDHDLAIGLSVIAGAAAGLIFPRTDWIPVALR